MNKFEKIMFGIMFWIVSLTWGALLTIPGIIIALFAILLGGTLHKNGCTFIIEVGNNWGGLEIGAIAFCGRYSQKEGPCYNPSWYEHTRAHEFGHNLQQLILGPFQLFLVFIPSAIRYWYSRIHGLKHPYDYALFEYIASKLGYYWMRKLDASFKEEYTYKRK